jgi:hypothetical protein
VIAALITSSLLAIMAQPVAVHLHNRTGHKLTMIEQVLQRTGEGAPRVGFALKRKGLEVYGEQAFRYFVEIERERASRAGRPCLVVLVELKTAGGGVEPMSASTAEGLFEALGQTVRETDFLGWYREGLVAGAALTELSDSNQRTAFKPVLDRIRRAADERLPVPIVSRLDVRVADATDEDSWS